MSFEVEQPSKAVVPIEALQFAGAVEFGSRALNVATQDSDYDFAILRSNYENLIELQPKIREVPIAKHFNVAPAKGNNTIAANVHTTLGKTPGLVDILILEHPKDVQIVAEAVQDLKLLPIDKLRNKKYRIKAYDKALLAHGFKPTNKLLKFIHDKILDK